MAQLQEGTAQVTSGLTRVIAGNSSIDWSTAQSALNNGVPLYFSVQGDTEIPFRVQAVTNKNISASGNWELTLSSPYNGDTNAAALYAIIIDFTPILGLSLLSPNDVQTAQLFSDNMNKLDKYGGSIVAGPANPNSPTNSLTVPSNYSLVVAGQYIIDSAIEITMGANAELLIID